MFECHQFMLSARSPVFRAMFQSDMTEAQTKRVDIQVDIEMVEVVVMTTVHCRISSQM